MIKLLCPLLLCVGALCASEEIINLKEYKGKAVSALKSAHGDPNALINAAHLFMDARDYATAETICGNLLRTGKYELPFMYSNYSVFLGKQGKYQAAIAAADKALALDPGNMHARAVKASWLYESGQTEAGIRLFEDIAVPAAGYPRILYFECRACFYGSVADEKQVREAMACVVTDSNCQVFFKNDVVFDKFRTKDWYMKFFGFTKVVAN